MIALGVALLAYKPFVQPLPVWDYWYLLLLPLCAAVSVVYKSIKCHEMKRVPREAAQVFATIVVGIVVAAMLLVLVVKLIS